MCQPQCGQRDAPWEPGRLFLIPVECLAQRECVVHPSLCPPTVLCRVTCDKGWPLPHLWQSAHRLFSWSWSFEITFWSLWTLLYHFFAYKVFTEHLLCANSFMAYSDDSNRPGLCHGDDDLHLCPLPPWDPPSGPSQRWAPSAPTFQMWSLNGGWELGSSLLSLPSGWWPTYKTLNLHSWGGGWAMWTPPFNPHTQKSWRILLPFKIISIRNENLFSTGPA